jgi:hypothetical protein
MGAFGRARFRTKIKHIFGFIRDSLSWRKLLLIGWVCGCFLTTSRAQPVLHAELQANRTIGLQWIDADGQFVLERSSSLQASSQWTQVTASPSVAGAVQSIELGPDAAAAFFRLRQSSPVVVGIRSTSPHPGESGVAVTRETIFHFTAPLRDDQILESSEIYAEAAGRRILSRAEIGLDRQTATLFYLENLPAASRVRVTLDGTQLMGPNGAVDGDGDGQPGGVYQMEFSTAPTTGLPGTGVIGYVYASEPGSTGTNKPLSNVTITVDGAEETLRTVTDTNGFFRLNPSPAGRFFVHVDGRTATGSQWPGGAYYPFVGKAWVTAAGRTNNLAGGNGLVFLPLVGADALKVVSATNDTKVSFAPSLLATNPALAGVEIIVPAGSLFADNGSRGGRVGLAPVARDRLPEPLPPGLNPPLVITVQTDGAMNFDRPVPARFPNLPDPVTGTKLPPGAKTVLWSFNHDTGRWEAQGTMTISADGNFAVTDPGVGIRQPGWHAAAPGTSASGPLAGLGSGSGAGGGPPDQCPPGSDCECTQKITCTFPKEGYSYGDCILICLGNIFDNQGESPALSPIEAGIQCIGGPDLCPGNVTDALTPSRRRCMDQCQFPDPDRRTYTMPCEGFTNPCPAPQGNGRAQPAGPFDSLLPDRLEEQRMFWSTEEKYLEALTGTSKILEMDEEGAERMKSFFTTLAERVRQGTPSGIHLSAQERSELVALPRPGNFSNADWTALIDRLDSFQGAPLPPAVAKARADIEELISVLKARGWKNRLDGLIQGSARLTWARAPKQGSTEFPARSHYYQLRNVTQGFTISGRLTSGGLFEGLVLAPNSAYTVAYFDPVTGGIGGGLFITKNVGQATRIPTAPLEVSPESPIDFDGDGLSDLAEQIVGTNPTKPDSDGDGQTDGSEIAANSDPLDGQPSATGVVGGLNLGGKTLVIDVYNDIAAVGIEPAQIAFVDVRNPLNPVLIQRFDAILTPTDVTILGNLVVFTEGTAIQIFDLSNREQPALVRTLEESASAIAGGEGNLYIAHGTTLKVRPLDETQPSTTLGLAQPIHALQVSDGFLHVLTSTQLRLYAIEGPALMERGSTTVGGGVAPLETGRKLFVAGGYAYVGAFEGFRVIDVRNPAEPVVVGTSTTTQAAIHDLVTDGNRLFGITSFGGAGSLAASLYNVRQPNVVTNFLTSFPTPGDARAGVVTRGIGLVADSQAGLTVVNYLAPDQGTNPPTISLQPRFSVENPPAQENGAFFWVRAQVSDDVLVREVEFYLDGELFAVDTTFPFEVNLRAPKTPTGTGSFQLRARARDTGGNASWTPAQSVPLAPDLTPPRVLSIVPPDGQLLEVGSRVEVKVVVSEPLATASLSHIRLLNTGADDLPDTADDSLVPSTAILSGVNEYTLNFTQPLPVGTYAVRVGAEVTDSAGIHPKSAFTQIFRMRHVLEFTGAINRIWDSSASHAGNWPGSRVPTSNDLVEINFPDVNPVVVQGLSVAGFLQTITPFEMIDGELTLVQGAVFQGPVTLRQGQMKGGDVWFRGQTDLFPNGVSVFDQNWWNSGTLRMNESSKITFWNRTSRFTRVHNIRAGIWEMNGASIAPGNSSVGPVEFLNEGRLIIGAELNRIALSRYGSLGTVEVRGGNLQITGGQLERGGHSRHLGSYQVETGATLTFEGRGNAGGNALHEFGRASVFQGNGNIVFGAGIPADMRGTFLGSGSNFIAGTITFSGPVQSAGRWLIQRSGGNAVFNGLNPEVSGQIQIDGSMTVNARPQMRVTDLNVAADLTVNTTLDIHGRVNILGCSIGNARLMGSGVIRSLGHLRTEAIVNSAGSGLLEIHGTNTSPSGTILQFNEGHALRVASTGTLNLNGITRVTVRGGVTNEGVVIKSTAGETELSRQFVNRGTVQANGGTLVVINGSYFQESGVTTLNTGGRITARRSGAVAVDPFFRLLGGTVDGAGVITCNSFINQGGQVSPGSTSTTGILDLQVGTHPTLSTYTQNAGAMTITLNGNTPGSGHDQVKVSGRALLGGRLILEVADGYDPAVGQEFVILTAAKVERQFGDVVLTGRQLVGKRLAVVYEPTQVKVQVVSGL